jgi:hypothetical protein
MGILLLVYLLHGRDGWVDSNEARIGREEFDEKYGNLSPVFALRRK